MVPSGNMSSPTAGPPPPTSSSASSHHMVPPQAMVGYTTTGRPSTHQQQPMSFTRALEISENLDQSSNARFMRASNQQQPQSSQQPQSNSGSGEAASSSTSNKETEDNRRDSVYDMNSYEISV